ncbi:MAG: DUF6508 domain-containing protein [Bacteroidetes bacterium]|nr:DUF6508 domain-containing protein [Bacteroidota bacterium]
MVSEANFEQHLKSIPESDWEKMFNLISVIQATEKFGTPVEAKQINDGYWQMPYSIPSKVVSNFFDIVHEIRIVVPFNWIEWAEGREAMRANFNYDDVSVSFLCKLITAIVRNDRFCEGVLEHAFEDRIIERILIALRDKVRKGDFS